MRLFDRDAELDAVAGLLADARAGRGGALLVEGAPGIGKSSLLDAARASCDGFRLVAARATELDRELAFGVVRQLLEPVLACGTDAERRAAMAGSGALAERVLGAPPAGERSDPDAAAALHGLFWFAANLASERPLLVLVDDLQWADAASLRWLVHLAPRLEGLPIALLLAARACDDELVDRLAADRAVRVLHPAELSEHAVAQMAAGALGEPPGAGFVRACRRATGGNPFLVGELLAELGRREIAPRDANAARVEQLSSREVRRAVRARLHGLPSGCLELARAVAVLGDGVDRSLAARTSGIAVAAAADQLAAAAILRPGPELAFAHPLVRESVYAELSAGERAAWHARAAEALGETGASADRIACHLLLTEPGGDSAIVRMLRQAAESARRRGAPDVARAHLRRALLEPPAADVESRVVSELGSAELHAGDVTTAIERLSDAVRCLPDPRSRALAAAELGTALTFMGDAEQAVIALTDAIDGLPPADRELGLMLEAARVSAGYSTLPAWVRLRTAQRRFEVSGREPGTVGEEMRVAELALEAAFRGTAPQAASLAGAAIAAGHLRATKETLANAYIFAPSALLFADELEEATRALGEVIACARHYGWVAVLSAASHLRAVAWWRRGALDEVEADARQALHDVGYHATPHGALALVDALLARGDVAAAAQVWDDAGLDSERDHGVSAIMRLHTRGRLGYALGRPQSALDDLYACGRLQVEWDVRTPAVANWRVDAVPLLASLGRGAEARALAEEELDAARAFGSARTLGAALRTMAGVEEGEGALALSARRSRCSRRPRRYSSTRSRSPRSARRSAEPGGGWRRAARCATRSSWRWSAARTPCGHARTTSSSPPARGHGATRSTAAAT